MSETITGEQANAEVMAEYHRQREAGELKATCRECVWFAGLGADGDCRRNEPVANEHGEAVFPNVKSHYWCGQFESRDKFVGRPPTVGEMTERSPGKPPRTA